MSLGADLLTAAGTGLLASLHCAAMCGPLAVAGCSSGRSLDGRATAGYFAARTLGYALLGAIMGALGRHALCLLPMKTVQSVALAGVAAAALLRGVRLLVPRRPSGLVTLRRPRRGVLASVAAFVPRRGAALGAVTSILPCGMLVAAWLLAASTASPASGALVMAAFSLASAPGLLAALAGRAAAGRVLARLPPLVTGIAWCALGIFVALRPLFTAAHCAP